MSPTLDPRLTNVLELLALRESGGADVAHGATPVTGTGAADLPQAAVALVLRPTDDDLELLLIRRADRSDDPWSGHMALPGGRVEAEDASLAATAMRETHEEVGIELTSAGTLLGALPVLNPRAPRSPRIAVHPFVFAVASDTRASTSDEVALTLWVGLNELAHHDAATEHELVVAGIEPLLFPAIDAQGHVVWGITYRVITGLLELTQVGDPHASQSRNRPDPV